MDVRHVALAAAVGGHPSLTVAVCLALSVTVSLREQDLSHAHCEEVEGRKVLAFIRTTVMATVWVTPEGVLQSLSDLQ